jgi:hypothetical protein
VALPMTRKKPRNAAMARSRVLAMHRVELARVDSTSWRRCRIVFAWMSRHRDRASSTRDAS